MPARTAFCTNSKLARPLTKRIWSADWKGSSKPLGADNFVYRIVPPDILPHEAKITSAIKQRRRMKSARPPKNLLGAAKLLRHPMDYLCADSEPVFPSQHSKRHASDCLK